MVQNRKKCIEKFIGNLANAIVHRICLAAAMKLPEIKELAGKYETEIKNSWEIAKIYREKINPKMPPFPSKDIEEIRKSTIGRVILEINSRILRGYKNLDKVNFEEEVDGALKELKVTD